MNTKDVQGDMLAKIFTFQMNKKLQGNYGSIKTSRGNTQKSERTYIAYAVDVLDGLGLNYTQASSQTHGDFSVNMPSSVDVILELKKTDSGIIMLNDTLPKCDTHYIIISTKYEKVINLRGSDFNPDQWIEYDKMIKELRLKYRSTSESIISAFPRPNYSVKVTSFLTKKQYCQKLTKKDIQDIKMVKKMKKSISLFSGMGGDTLGMEWAGFEVTGYAEFIKTFRASHETNFTDSVLIGKDVNGDVTKITDAEITKHKDKVNLIFAGFSCQSFSSAGERKEDDPRDNLYKEFLRFARIIGPKYVIGENVKGLLTKKKGDVKYIDLIVSDLEELGYNVEYKVLDCSKYGVPQKRERLFIIGSKTRVPTFPDELDDYKPSIVDIVKYSNKGIYQITKDVFDYTKLDKKYIITDMSDDTQTNDPHPYLKMKCDSKDVEYDGKTHGNLISFGKRDSPIHCEVVNLLKPTKTIICTYAHQPRFFVLQRNKIGYFLRCFTVDELKQIQGFPLEFSVCGNRKEQIQQIGNAVPPVVVQQIVAKLST